MLNSAITASMPAVTQVVEQDGKFSQRAGIGFLQKLLGALDETQDQTETKKQKHEDGSEAVITLMLAATPVQSVVSYAGETTEADTADVKPDLTRTPAAEQPCGSDMSPDQELMTLATGVSEGDEPVLIKQPSEAGQETLDAVRSEAGEEVPYPTAASTGSKAPGDPPASPPVTTHATASGLGPRQSGIIEAPSSGPDEIIRLDTEVMRRQADDLVGRLWRQSLLAKQTGRQDAKDSQIEPGQAASTPSIDVAESATDKTTAQFDFRRELAAERPVRSERADVNQGAELAVSERAFSADTGPNTVMPPEMDGEGRAGAKALVERDQVVFKTLTDQSAETPPEPEGDELPLSGSELPGFSGALERANSLDNAHQPASGQPSPVKNWPSPHEQVLDGLETGIRQLQTIKAGERTTVKMQLFPKELGEVRVRVELIGRTVTAQFEASSSTTANLLREGLPALREALDSQGFTEVSLTAGFAGDFAQARDGRDGHSSRQQPRANYTRMQQLVPVAASHESQADLGSARLDYRL